MKYINRSRSIDLSSNLKSKRLFILLIPVLLILPFMSLFAQQSQDTTKKSPEDATAFAIMGTGGLIIFSQLFDNTGAELVFLAGGLVIGPIAGYIYMDQPRLGLKYAGTRALVMGATAGSIAAICSLGNCDLGLFGNESGDEFGIALFIGLAGVTTTVIQNVVDSFRVYRRVEAHTKTHHLAFRPVYFPRINTLGISARFNF